MRARLTAVLWLAAIVMADCGGDRNGGDKTAGSNDLASAPRWTAEEVVRIGSVDDPDQALTVVRSAVIGPDTALYLSQPQDGEIRVYDSRGLLIRTIGRAGEGPGEFSSGQFALPHSVGVKGDTLYAADDGLARVSFFSLDGRVLDTRSWHTDERSAPLETNPGVQVMYMPTVPQVLLPDGTALTKVLTSPMSTSFDPQGSVLTLGPVQVPFVHIDARGEVIDTIVKLPTEMVSLRVDGDNGSSSYQIPFAQDERLGALMRDGSGVVLVDRSVAVDGEDATLGVTLIGISGDTVFSRRFAYDPVAPTDEWVSQTARDFHESGRRGADASGVEAIEAALRDNGVLPPQLPPVTALSAGQDGSIWLRRENAVGDSVLWNVLDAEGQLRGAVRLPSRDSVIAARGDLVATVQYDELDVPYVVEYRLHH